jgi:ketosteroid isomerase-like protein
LLENKICYVLSSRNRTSVKYKNMDDLISFMKAYEQANNSHVFAKVKPFIAENATYWFTDGSFKGIDEIQAAVEATFDKIQDEDYQVKELRWVIEEDSMAVCTYTFTWSGTVDGISKQGSGRGTNILKKQDGRWQIVHEHLSV